MRSVLRGLVVGLVSVLAVACGSSPAPAPGTDEAPRAPEPATLVAPLRSPALLHSRTFAAGSPDVTKVTNSAYVETVREQSGVIHEYVGAQFGSYSSQEFLGSADGCKLYNADKTSGADVSGSAGTLTFTLPSETVVIDPVGTTPAVAYNEASSTDGVSFGDGTFSVSAAGGPDLGAFSGSVHIPNPIAGFTYPTSISRAAGYNVSWMGRGDQRPFQILVSASSASGSVADLLCLTTDTGSFTITSAALSLYDSKYTSASVVLVRPRYSYEEVGTVNVTIDAEEVLAQTEPATLGP